MKIATHDERFHADEIFAIAILKSVFPHAKIIRTRKPEIYSKCDIVVDIGREYNLEGGNLTIIKMGLNLGRMGFLILLRVWFGNNLG